MVNLGANSYTPRPHQFIEDTCRILDLKWVMFGSDYEFLNEVVVIDISLLVSFDVAPGHVLIKIVRYNPMGYLIPETYIIQ